MVAVVHTVASDEASNHSPSATDLSLGLIIFGIYILALTCHVIDPDHEALSNDDSFEPVMLDQIAPARTYRQWTAEMNDVVNTSSGFNTW
ncbi:hypothetical protein BKA60DRAFT_600134 [Fusarium oxysporum]|nr:hypothetical protein BKA60DRAFT_600134 [Fusarium oxysporum]